jgi:hypothetical protein
MIKNETFIKALEAAYKGRKMPKKERNININAWLGSTQDRDSILDHEEGLTRKYKADKAKEHTIPSEHEEQVNFVAWFRKTYPGVLIFAIPNGGSRHIAEAQKLVLEGVVSGVADLFIPDWLCWIEFKRVKGSSWSDDQKEFKRYVESIGQVYLLMYGFDFAKDLIESFVRDGQHINSIMNK